MRKSAGHGEDNADLHACSSFALLLLNGSAILPFVRNVIDIAIILSALLGPSILTGSQRSGWCDRRDG
jgi:hypothetical protein